MFFRDHVNSLP